MASSAHPLRRRSPAAPLEELEGLTRYELEMALGMFRDLMEGQLAAPGFQLPNGAGVMGDWFLTAEQKETIREEAAKDIREMGQRIVADIERRMQDAFGIPPRDGPVGLSNGMKWITPYWLGYC